MYVLGVVEWLVRGNDYVNFMFGSRNVGFPQRLRSFRCSSKSLKKFIFKVFLIIPFNEVLADNSVWSC